MVASSLPGTLGYVTNPRLFITRYWSPQLKLFALEDVLGEGGWLKALKLDGYAARFRTKPAAPQDVLFPYADAL